MYMGVGVCGWKDTFSLIFDNPLKDQKSLKVEGENMKGSVSWPAGWNIAL